MPVAYPAGPPAEPRLRDIARRSSSPFLPYPSPGPSSARRSASSDRSTIRCSPRSRRAALFSALHYINGQERQGAGFAHRGYPKAVSAEDVPDRIAAKPRKSRGISKSRALRQKLVRNQLLMWRRGQS